LLVVVVYRLKNWICWIIIC